VFVFVPSDVLIDNHLKFFVHGAEVAFGDVAEFLKDFGIDAECKFRQL